MIQRATAICVRMTLDFSPYQIVRALAFVTLALLAIHLAGHIVTWQSDSRIGFHLVRLFDLNREHTVPALWSAFLLMFSAFLLAATGIFTRKSAGGGAYYWLGLAAIFAFLAADEAFSFHEMLNNPLRRIIGGTGLLHFSWVIPYAAAAILLGCLYLKFIMSQSPRVRNAMFLAALLYCGGAIGIEMLGGAYFEQHHDVIRGGTNIVYLTLYTIEETLEMAGVMCLIYALLACISERWQHIHLQIKHEFADEAPAAAVAHGGRQ